jgi:hypothetical protein
MNNYYVYSLPIVILLIATILYLTRNSWLQRLPPLPFDLPDISLPRHFYSRLPGSSSFHDDAAAGLTSSAFDLAGNIEAGDSRRGLDDAGKREVQRIMRRERVGFDEARRRYMQEGFRRNDIGPDGRPRDPKFVSFS